MNALLLHECLIHVNESHFSGIQLNELFCWALTNRMSPIHRIEQESMFQSTLLFHFGGFVEFKLENMYLAIFFVYKIVTDLYDAH